MRIFKFIVSLITTIALIYALNTRLLIGDKALPPLGKFLDPFQGFWQNMERRDHALPSDINIPGLQGKVTVVFDSLMIPHIFADNSEDLYLAQGYITAYHRLWQMEFQTHAAAGRLSEILGVNEGVLDYDRAQRRKGMMYAARNALKGMEKDPYGRKMVEKYSEGVNLYIASLNYKTLPFEYKLLDYRPEDWSPLKCALVLKNLAQTLNIGDKDIEMTNALKLFGKEMVDVLYPDHEGVSDPIVDNPGGWKFKPINIDTIPLAVPLELIAVKRLPRPDPTTGSNNWAVSGNKTSTGSPMLAGDPHLNLTLPSIWYALQMKGPESNTMGVSVPGAPCIIIGFNDSVAWSMTNAQRDLVDWFKITFEDQQKNRYLLDNQWLETKKVVEEIKVRGAGIFYDTVIYTSWGPVTYDESYHAQDNLKHYAFRWVAHDESNELKTIYLLNQAKNHLDYMEALNHFTSPAQNFVFASVSGDIGMRIQGKYPLRRKDEGKFVLDGSKRSNGWQYFIPNEQNAVEKNPARGFSSSANQYPVDATYPYYVTATHYEAYRNRRINSVLSKPNSFQVSDMMQLQNDNYNLKAEESLPVFLAYLDTMKLNPAQQQAFQILKEWDYYNHKDSEGASYYEAWWDNLMPMLWDEIMVSKVPLERPTTFNTIKLIRQKPDFVFFDNQSTPEKETAGDVIRKAFALGVEEVEKWKTDRNTKNVYWGDYKGSYMRHLMRLAPLNIKVRAGGNHDIVNAHTQTHGPSWRMIVSLEKAGVKCWATYPGGQSGNPGSPYYGNMIPHWVDGKYFPMRFMHSPDEARDQVKSISTLNPAK